MIVSRDRQVHSGGEGRFGYMRPKVILSNAVSLNGSLTGFPVDLGTYYSRLLAWRPDAVLVGSQTVLLAHEEIPPEVEADFIRPECRQDDPRPMWVVVDSRGVLEGRLHLYRRMEYTRGIIILLSKKTPERYRRYLADRQYETITAGEDRVDLARALDLLGELYGVETLVTDTGGTLNRVLLDAGLVDEISVILVPVLAGTIATPLYRSERGEADAIPLSLERCEPAGDGYLHLIYRVQ
jgi:2,5-diamino-6-(ribosylamino)-4(3H)-pyrimidinone 5'-phosphate reductase